MRASTMTAVFTAALHLAIAPPTSAAVVFGEQRGSGSIDTFECFDTGMSTYCSQSTVNAQTPATLMPGVDYSGSPRDLTFTSVYAPDSVALSLAQGPYSASFTVFDAASSWNIDIELSEPTIIDIVAAHLSGYPSSRVGVRENCSFSDCTASTLHDWSLGDANEPPFTTSMLAAAGLHRLFLVAGLGSGYAANTATFTMRAVPEPGTALLVGCGLVGFGLRGRSTPSAGRRP